MPNGLESGNDEPEQPYRLRSLALPVYLPQFLFSVGQGAILPIIPLLAIDNLGASIPIAGLIVGLRGVGTIVFDVPAGVLVGRFGERRSVAVATMALVLISILAANSTTAWMYGALVFLFGAAAAVWHLARLTFVSANVPTAQRGRAMSLLGGTNRVGAFVGPVLGGLLGVAFGLESAYYLQAFLAAVGATAMLAFVKAQDDMAEVAHGSVLQQVGGVISEHRRVFLTAGVVAMSISTLRHARQAILPLWGSAIGLDAAAVGLLFSLSSAIDMGVFYPVGMLMDRRGRKWAAIPCLVVMGVAMCLIPLTYSAPTLMAVGLLLGAGNGFGAGIVMTLGSDFAPATQRGEFLGVWRLIADIGQGIGPLLIGGVSAVATLGAAAVATGGIGLAAAVLMWTVVPETLHLPDVRPKPRIRLSPPSPTTPSRADAPEV